MFIIVVVASIMFIVIVVAGVMFVIVGMVWWTAKALMLQVQI